MMIDEIKRRRLELKLIYSGGLKRREGLKGLSLFD